MFEKTGHQCLVEPERPNTATACTLDEREAIAEEMQIAVHPPQLLSPVIELRIQHMTRQPLPLPDGKVGVLYRQFGQWRGRPLGESLIQDGHFIDEEPDGPAIGHDVVHRDEQRVVGIVHTQQNCTQEPVCGQVEDIMGL